MKVSNTRILFVFSIKFHIPQVRMYFVEAEA